MNRPFSRYDKQKKQTQDNYERNEHKLGHVKTYKELWTTKRSQFNSSESRCICCTCRIFQQKQRLKPSTHARTHAHTHTHTHTQ